VGKDPKEPAEKVSKVSGDTRDRQLMGQHVDPCLSLPSCLQEVSRERDGAAKGYRGDRTENQTHRELDFIRSVVHGTAFFLQA